MKNYKVYMDAAGCSVPFTPNSEEVLVIATARELEGSIATARKLGDSGELYNAKINVLYEWAEGLFEDFVWNDDQAAELQQIEYWCTHEIFPFRVSCPEGNYIVYGKDEILPRVHCISNIEKYVMRSVDLW